MSSINFFKHQPFHEVAAYLSIVTPVQEPQVQDPILQEPIEPRRQMDREICDGRDAEPGTGPKVPPNGIIRV